ncbi:biotin--[acetyl-CoA-carboxylase] ligase [Umezawaea sp. NPDC059074]|uniref:biotin--[acetyl-CoA-carboxylase] ligase n=1 Tax=Umezawaea sp. NPDC059074 TaxID=3346716 RepID=UPI0036D07F34
MSTPLDVDALRSRLVGPYAAIDFTPSTRSTNADLVRAAADGAPDRTVLIADEQTAGQGRRGRTWVSPPGSGLYVSVLFRPTGVDPARLPWLTLIAGLSLVRVADALGVQATLKWPNDLLLGPDRRKGAGVLAETSGGAVVVGIGLNIAPLPTDVVPGPGGLTPTSLADEGATDLDRTTIAERLLTALSELESDWRSVSGDARDSGLLDDYREHCSTLGQRVRVELTGGAELLGTGHDIALDGTLVVRADNGVDHSVSAGDVVHLRPV